MSFHDPFRLPQDCSRCQGPAGRQNRAEWGCKKETIDVQLWIPCLCETRGRCKVCGDRGFVPIRRCPRQFVDEGTGELLALHRHWPAALPDAGGIYDQAATYVDAMRILDMGEAMMDRELRKQAEERRGRD